MNALEFEKIYARALKDYLTSGQKLFITGEISHDTTKARSSGMSSCELALAYERLKVEPTNPEATTEENIHYLLGLQSGSQLAEMHQAAMVWHASRRYDLMALTESNATSHNTVGRMDLMLSRWNGTEEDIAIVDFKFSMDRDGEPAGPHHAHAFQLLAYNRAINGRPEYFDNMLVVTLGKGGQFVKGFQVWELVPEDGGFRFYDTSGEPYKPPKYQGNWNIPEALNMNELEIRIQRQLDMLDRVRTSLVIEPFTQTHIDPPIADPLNDERGWQCLKKDYATMTAEPRCPWARKCHGITGPTKYAKEGSVLTWNT